MENTVVAFYVWGGLPAQHIDESALHDSDSLFVEYVQFFRDKGLMDEMLFTARIKTDTEALFIFEVVNDCLPENSITFKNRVDCVTGGAVVNGGEMGSSIV